ncbi:MAG: FAD/NAD(P)-binding protein [Desulfobulbales bacterium]|nr:FAD/NAD(P)-binding protein [Desulfobulbales bacterium]
MVELINPGMSLFAKKPRGREEDDLFHKAEITNVYPMTATEKLYQIQIIDPAARRGFLFKPGQFIMLEAPGIGEAPFSISSAPSRLGNIELCIRAVGVLTRFLSRLERGVMIGISGPFGTCFPVEEMVGEDVILLAGGLGIVPMRSPIMSLLENRSRYGRIDVMYGARRPSELLFGYQHAMWRQFDIGLKVIVDRSEPGWTGPVGMITALLAKRLAQGERSRFGNATNAIVCGPPVMFKPICDMLLEAGLSMEKIFVSLERRMHCGRGKCCRCNIGSTYTCLDGPVFDYWSVLNLKEAI